VAESPPRRGLGRGLAALVAEFPSGQVSLMELELSQVHPNRRQPRQRFDEDAIGLLADSIVAEGVVQPIVVREAGEGYEIIAGERRWRAAQRAGLRTIPAIVRQADDRESLILALAENVAREDLNPVEQARAYAVLADELDLTQAEIGRRLGKSRAAVANTLRLLELPDEVLELIEAGQLSEGHGRAILQVSGQDERLGLARQSVARGLSVRQAEAAAKARKSASPKQQARPGRGGFDDELAHLAVDAAWQSLNLKATVRMGPRGGRVELHFTTTAELGRIVDQLRAERLSWAD
jgi:ParB family transcriptional regulator, chromosome partitioning protein